MTFSVVIPVHNTARYLRACLDSLLAQTFQDWEAVCVDDGSTDESGAILDGYAVKDGRFRVIHQSNGGEGAARNAGLEAARGTWICFVDSDDILNSRMLETYHRQIEGHKDSDLIPNANVEFSGLFERNVLRRYVWILLRQLLRALRVSGTSFKLGINALLASCGLKIGQLRIVGALSIWYSLFFLDRLMQVDFCLPETFPLRVHLFFQPLCYAGVLTAFAVVLGRWRWILFPFYAYVLTIECVECCLVSLFGGFMTSDLLLIVQNSNLDEVRAFFSEAMPGTMIVASVLVMALGFWLAKFLFWGDWRMKRWKRCVCAALLVCPFIAFDVCFMSPTLIPQQMICSCVIRDSLIRHEADRKLYEACVSPVSFGDVHVDFVEGSAPVGVFLIGESLTRNNMGIYGYVRDTTPCMRQLKDGKMFVFRDVLGCCHDTLGALGHLLTEMEIDGDSEPHCAFPGVCRRAGYRCALLSNQGHWGSYETRNTLLFHACGEKTWLREDGGGHDMDLLERLVPKLSGREPFIAFLHLADSHWPFRNYPDKFRRFLPDATDVCPADFDEVQRSRYNHYDNSILETDALFAGIVGNVKTLKRPAFVVLVSDHGESPRLGKMRQMQHLDVWEIPLVVWVSDEYERIYPEIVRRIGSSVNRPLQQDQLFVGLLSLARVVGYSRATAERDFLSPSFCPRKVRLVQNGQVPYVRAP